MSNTTESTEVAEAPAKEPSQFVKVEIWVPPVFYRYMSDAAKRSGETIEKYLSDCAQRSEWEVMDDRTGLEALNWSAYEGIYDEGRAFLDGDAVKLAPGPRGDGEEVTDSPALGKCMVRTCDFEARGRLEIKFPNIPNKITLVGHVMTADVPICSMHAMIYSASSSFGMKYVENQV